MTIPAVSPITALAWALEVGEVQRFSSIKKAADYALPKRSSANIIQRTPSLEAVKETLLMKSS
jgi:hypothetical protein